MRPYAVVIVLGRYEGEIEMNQGSRLRRRVMRPVFRGAWGALAAVALLAAFAAPAYAAEYTFEKVADSEQGLDASGSCPAINDRGDIAFRAVTPATGAERIVRANAGGGVTTIVNADVSGLSFLGNNPSINDLAAVSFAASRSGGDGEIIAKGRGGALTTIAQTEPGPFNFFGFDTSINNRGRVAFKAELDQEFDFDEGLFSGRGGPIKTYYLASTSPFAGSDEGPSLNDAGQVAFFEFTDNFETGVFLYENPGFVRIARDALSPDNPSLNSSGLVAFNASFFQGGEQVHAIMTGDGGPPTIVVDTSEGPFSFFDEPSLNDDGQVSFVAELGDFSNNALFAGPDPIADRVIGTGDTLDGEIVSSVYACGEALNNAGQLAFTAFFEDPETFEIRTAVFRATPVPSPSS